MRQIYGLLKKYENQDYLLQQKAKVLFHICVTIIIILPISIINSLFMPHSLAILLPIVIAFLLLSGAFYLLIKGYYAIASHMVLNIGFVTTWLVIFLDRSGLIHQLDTIAFILGLLTMTALVESSNKRLIIFYSCLNALILTLFVLYTQHYLALPIDTAIEYWTDNIVTIAFICVTSYSLFSINQKALDKAQNEISEREQAENITARTNAFLEMSLSSIPNGVLLLDPHTRFSYVNPTFLNWVGRTSKDFIGKSFAELIPHYIPQESGQRVTDDIMRAMAHHRNVIQAEFDLIGNHQILKNISFSAAGIHKEDEQHLGWVAILVDHTEHKKLEASLRQTHKMEAIGTLAGGIAHDFNNILSSVIGFSELALDDSHEDTIQHSNIQQILTAAHRAKKLVRQILTFARQQDFELKPIQLNTILNETLKFLRSSIPTTIEIQANLKSTGYILADPTQIHQVIMNLCTNASHAMEPNGGNLAVSLADKQLSSAVEHKGQKLEPGDYLVLSVSDTGMGIPSNQINSIFDPFFTTKKPGKGTGMGLSVVHGIVDKCRGAIFVESQIGQGTTLDVYFPRLNMENTPNPKSALSPPVGNERILIVDDEETILDMLKQMLQKSGYAVTTQTQSVAALSLFQGTPDKFDLVILDMTMPRMNGDQLATEMLKIRPDIPIVLCTGYHQEISEKRALAIGIQALLVKPIAKKDLTGTIRNLLDVHQN